MSKTDSMGRPEPTEIVIGTKSCATHSRFMHIIYKVQHWNVFMTSCRIYTAQQETCRK